MGGDRGNWGSAERRWHAQLPTRSRRFRGRWPNGSRSVVSGPSPRALSPQTTQGSPHAPVCAPTPQPAGAASPGLASASSKYSQIRQHLPRARIEGWVSLWGQSWGAPKESRGPSEKSRGHPRAPHQVQGTLIRAPEKAGLPRKEQHVDGSGDGWAGVPGSGPPTSGPRPHNRLWWGGRGLGEVRLGTVTLLSQTTSQQRRSRIHTSVHHDTNKFPLFNCLIKKTLQSADVWLGPPPCSWPIAHGCSRLHTQPA